MSKVSGNEKAIGVDIGGTKTAVAAVDAAGRIHSRRSFVTRSQRGFPLCLRELVGCVRDVLTAAKWKADALCGIGIGCAGPVNPLRGTIHNPYTLPGWDGADIVASLREAFGVPVCLENDADAAGFGEFQFGAGRGASPLVMVTLGTGVGGAVLVGGRICRGVNGEHPELGHIAVLTHGPQCYCGAAGCWESLASGTAIAAAGEQFGFKNSRAVFAAASNDAQAASIVRRAVEATVVGVWTLCHTILPQRLLLGGGIGEEHFAVFAVAIRQQIARATQFSKDRVEIVKAGLGNDAGIIGAASLAFQGTNPTKTP
jgi:glucokinase